MTLFRNLKHHNISSNVLQLYIIQYKPLFTNAKSIHANPLCFYETRCKFHHCFTHSFFDWKSFAQLISSCVLALYFFGAKVLSLKLLVKCWWNWLQVVFGTPEIVATKPVLTGTSYAGPNASATENRMKKYWTWILDLIGFWDLN